MLKYPLIDTSTGLFPTELPNYICSITANNFPFILESDNWLPVDNIQDADVIPITFKYREEQENQIRFLQKVGVRPDQLLLVMHIWDDCDTYDWTSLYRDFTNTLNDTKSNYKSILVHNNKKGFINGINPEYTIYYDHMWNRTKAYYTDYDRVNPIDKIYTFGAHKKNWSLNPIHKTENSKIFICPNRIFPFISPRLAYRKMLKLLLEDKNGYMSDPTNQVFLYPEEESLLSAWQERNNYGGGHWWPVANRYYENSFISIFVETITIANEWYIQNPWEAISEKTYDPLIKGHFILPFSYPGIIKDLKDMDFKFPDWINYDYDSIRDNNFRFAAFLEEAKRLVSLPITDYYNLFTKDKHILEHNRQVFFNRPYSTLYDKVKKVL